MPIFVPSKSNFLFLLGKDTAAEVNAQSVKKVHAVFVAGTGLKHELEDMPIEKFPE
jgi:hypothetical protein